jgi:hypothetical protein
MIKPLKNGRKVLHTLGICSEGVILYWLLVKLTYVDYFNSINPIFLLLSSLSKTLYVYTGLLSIISLYWDTGESFIETW